MHGEIDVEGRADLQFASCWMPPLLIDKLAERHVPSPIGNQIPIIRVLLRPQQRLILECHFEFGGRFDLSSFLPRFAEKVLKRR